MNFQEINFPLKMKRLEQQLVESKVELKKFSCTKPTIVDDRFVSISIKPKADNVCIPCFKRNHKKKAYFARLDKCKSSNIDVVVSKPMSIPPVREQKKSVFMPSCHLCCVIGHIRPKFSLLRQEPKSKTRSAVRNTDIPKFVHVCHFCGGFNHISPNYHKLKFKNFVF